MISYCSPKTGALLSTDNNQMTSSSGESFAVVNGIPRFVPEDNYAAAFGLQWKTFTKTQLDSHSQLPITRERLERCLGIPLAALKGKTVLEVGCGAGRFTELLVDSGALVHAIDLSIAVEANKENIGTRHNYTVAQASVYELPFPDESFDYVICLGVIQHTPDSNRTIEALWKKVAPHGSLVIDHYRWRIAYFSTLKPLYRHWLRTMEPSVSKKKVDALVDFFFPWHWRFRKFYPAWWLLQRISPLIEYIHLYPDQGYDFHLEWSRLDSYDSLTDYYKHLKTPGQIRSELVRLGGKSIWVATGGNGVEARCVK